MADGAGRVVVGAGALCSSSGMSKATEVPWTAGAVEMVTEPMAAVACSVHASISMGCGTAAWGVVKSSIAMVALR